MDLERALTDLADHLDVPDTAGSSEALAQRLRTDESGGRRSRRVRALLAVAAAIVVVSAGLLIVTPARDAVADWLGIGAVAVRRADPIPITTPSTTRPPVAATSLDDARKAVQFEIGLPQNAVEKPSPVTVDRRVPGGLVTLTYDRFTLVEIATDRSQPPPLAKLVGGTDVEPVTVHGDPGVWIPDAHQIGYIDRSGEFKFETLRQSRPVLLWERDGVTYRVEGPTTMDEAMAIANSIV